MRAITTFDHVTKQFKTIIDRSEPESELLEILPPRRSSKALRKRRVMPVWIIAPAILFHAWRA